MLTCELRAQPREEVGDKLVSLTRSTARMVALKQMEAGRRTEDGVLEVGVEGRRGGRRRSGAGLHLPGL